MTELQRDICNLDFSKSKHLCQPINHVYSCVDLNFINVISASLPAKGQKFRRFSADMQRICNGAKNCEIRFVMSVRLSVCPYILTAYTEMSRAFSKISLEN